MRMKRIAAGILSFILIMGNSLTAFATDLGSASVFPMDEMKVELAESVSDNSVETTEIETEMENESVDSSDIFSEYMQIAEEARADLQRCIKEKDIYALIYLTDFYDVKALPNIEADTVCSLPSAKTVQVMNMEVSWEYLEEWEEYIPTVWYEIQFYLGEELCNGYIEDSFLAYSDELLLQWKNDWYMLFPMANAMYALSASYTDVQQFPTSYQSYLKKLKDAHPNWTFVPMNVNRDWDECVSEQLGNYSWIYYNQPAEYRAGKINSTWYYASKAGIAYYMDPRNFLTEANIFQFEQNTYNASYHTQDALQAFLNNTFMKGNVPGDPSGRTYAQVIFQSGKSRGLSPFNLAARVIQEQGVNGTSAMISGTYSGYEGYYNHYNIGASGTTNAEVLKNGLTYAKNKGWNTRTKSLEGGAAFIGNGYILKGQDTLYLQKFDVEHGSSYLHQYMQNIMAPYSEGRSMKTMYTNAGSLNSAFVFKIPVYKNMPGGDYKLSSTSLKIERDTTKQLTVKCNGVAISEGVATFSSDDEKVATVDDKTGLVTAVGSGTTTIRAVIEDDMEEPIELECTVTVFSPLKGITLNIEKQELFLADGLPEKVAYLDENGKTKYKYKNKGELPTQVTLEVSYNPSDTTDSRTVTWTIENEDIISLEKQGDNNEKAVVTAKKSGTTTVTATVGKYSETAEITVRVPMTEAKLNQNELTLHKGESTQITATYLPFDTSDRVEPVWKSDNEAVAVVEDGRIVAKGTGTTMLHAAIGPFDGSQSELTVEVTVTEYEVTFMSPDGSVLLKAAGEYGKPLQNLVADRQAEIPWTPEKENSYFIGWYTKEDGNGDLVTQNSILYGNMTLYPYFTEESTAEFYVKPVGSVTYTGAYIKPDVKVYNKNTLLKKDVDYTLSYKNNKAVNVGSNPDKSPTVIITGKGQYSGTEVVETFIIAPKNISHIDVTAKNLSTEYTGKLQKLRPSVSDAGRTLQKDIDYTLEYVDTANGAYREPGTYSVKITGIGNYTGTRYVYITITKRIMMSDVSVSLPSEVKYNNGNPFTTEEELAACRPQVTVKYNGNTLKESTDYILAYSNNKEIGTASVTVIGQGCYIGAHTESFKIVGTDIATTTITGIVNKEYSGEAITQSNIVVANKNKEVLREGLDYKISYQNNIKTGKASVIFTGIHGYSGSVIKTFAIEPYDISSNVLTYETKPAFEVKLLTKEAEYDKSGVKPEVTATFKGENLKQGTDFEVSYENNYKVSGEESELPPTVIITGKGVFAGTISRYFTISQKNIRKVTMTVKDVKFRNRQGFCFTEPVLTDESGRRLKAGTDYKTELVYTYGTDVVLYDGTIRLAGERVLETDIPTPGELEDAVIVVTATGIGNYTGTVSASYRVLKNTSWLEKLFEEKEEPELKLNRTVLYLDPVYPEAADSIKLSVKNATLIEDKTIICYKGTNGDNSKDIAGLFDIVLENGRLTLKLNESREKQAGVLPDGNYIFVITPVVETEGVYVTLPERTVTVRVYRNNSSQETKSADVNNKNIIVANTVDFSDTKIAFLGDCITGNVGLERVLAEGNTYSNVVKRVLNPEAVYRLGYGGKSVSCYWDSLMDDYEKIPLDIDIIFVLAGINDVYSGNEFNFGSPADLSRSKTFCADTYKLMSSLQERYPKAQIIFLTPLSTVTNTSHKGMLSDTIPTDSYVNAIKAIAAREELTNVEVWDLFNSNLFDGNNKNGMFGYLYDGVHLGVAGHRVLGEYIAGELIRMEPED